MTVSFEYDFHEHKENIQAIYECSKEKKIPKK